MDRSITRRELLIAFSLLAVPALVPALATRPGAGRPSIDELQAQRLAWAGVRLRLGKDDLFLDPLANKDVWGDALKDEMVPLGDTEGARFVLITHRHPDHFDPVAVRQIVGPDGIVVTTQDNAATVAAAGFKVRVAALYEPMLLNDFTATAVPAVDGYGDPQVSWVVSAAGRRVLHGGDTLWHGAWWHVGRQLGPFDAVFLPINGAKFGWRKPVADLPSVLTPEQAVAAARILGARLLVPIHYGIVGAEGYAEIDRPAERLWAAARARSQEVKVLKPGEWLTWAE